MTQDYPSLPLTLNKTLTLRLPKITQVYPGLPKFTTNPHPNPRQLAHDLDFKVNSSMFSLDSSIQNGLSGMAK